MNTAILFPSLYHLAELGSTPHHLSFFPVPFKVMQVPHDLLSYPTATTLKEFPLLSLKLCLRLDFPQITYNSQISLIPTLMGQPDSLGLREALQLMSLRLPPDNKGLLATHC